MEWLHSIAAGPLAELVNNGAEIAAVAIAGFIARLLYKLFGITLDTKRQNDLKKAIASAIEWIVTSEKAGGLSRTITLDEGVDYVRNSVPEAWEHFGAPALVVKKQIEAGVKSARELLDKVTGG